MRKGKIHLRSGSQTSCGKDSLFHFLSTAKKYSEVTCKSCKQSWVYKQYLLGKFKEKPPKSQTQGYMDIIQGK